MITSKLGTEVVVCWRIVSKDTKNPVDFSGVKAKVFLIGPHNKYVIPYEAIKDAYRGLRITIPTNGLSIGVYDMKVIWLDDKLTDRIDYRNVSMKTDVFSLTDNDSEVTYTAPICIATSVESFGRDGMSAYEIGVFRGVVDDEMAWLGGGRYISGLNDETSAAKEIGGISKGVTVDELEEKTFAELFDDLIFPATNPTVEKPSIEGFELATLITVVEVGTDVIPVSPAGFNYGKWIEYNNVDGSDLEYAGHPYEISYLFVINGIPVSLRNLLPQHNMPTVPSTYTVAGDNIYIADIHYYRGKVPVNNRKEEVPEIACPGGSVSKTNIVNASYSYEATLCQNELDSSPALNSYLEKCSIVGNKGYIEMLRIKDGYIMEKKDSYVYPIFKVYGKLKELNVYDSMAKENEEGVRVSSLLPRLQAIEEKINDIKTGYTIYQYPEDLEIGKQKIYSGIIEFNI